MDLTFPPKCYRTKACITKKLKLGWSGRGDAAHITPVRTKELVCNSCYQIFINVGVYLVFSVSVVPLFSVIIDVFPFGFSL